MVTGPGNDSKETAEQPVGEGPPVTTAGEGPVPPAAAREPRTETTGGDASRPAARAGYDVAETLYGLLFQPAATMERLAQAPPLGLAVVIWILVAVLSGMATMGLRAPGLFPLPPVGTTFLPLWLVGGILFGFTGWFVTAAVFHLLAEFMGGRGSGLTLFALVGLSQLPRIFNAPLALLSGTLEGGFRLAFSFLLSIWVWYLYVLAISRTHRFSAGRGLAVVVLPAAVLTVFTFMAVLLAASLFAHMPVPFRSLFPWFR